MTDNTSPLNEYQIAIRNLKRALKESKYTYKEVAQSIGLSESGVKKIFSAKDGSFQRFAEISKLAGVSLSELLEDKRMLDVSFSVKQQNEFLSKPILFQFYWLLVYERQPIKQIKKELKLTPKEAFSFTRKLDTLNLLKLMPGDRLRLPSIKAVRWRGAGKFLTKIYRDWSIKFISDLAKPEDEQKEELFVIRYFQMTKQTYSDFVSAHKELEKEFSRRSIQEMKTKTSKLGHVRFLSAIDNRSFVTGNKLN